MNLKGVGAGDSAIRRDTEERDEAGVARPASPPARVERHRGGAGAASALVVPGPPGSGLAIDEQRVEILAFEPFGSRAAAGP